MNDAFGVSQKTIRALQNKYRRKAEPVKRPVHRIGRNDFCYCGSAKKYKRCCGRNR